MADLMRRVGRHTARAVAPANLLLASFLESLSWRPHPAQTKVATIAAVATANRLGARKSFAARLQPLKGTSRRANRWGRCLTGQYPTEWFLLGSQQTRIALGHAGVGDRGADRQAVRLAKQEVGGAVVRVECRAKLAALKRSICLRPVLRAIAAWLHS